MNQKEIAIECLKKLDIYKPYIRKFENEDMPTFFERCAGFYLLNDPVLHTKVKQLEKENEVLVYALTHEWFDFGECWSMLCVPKLANTIDDCLLKTSQPNNFYAFAYVWNQDTDRLSEFGDIVVKSYDGSIRRIG